LNVTETDVSIIGCYQNEQ